MGEGEKAKVNGSSMKTGNIACGNTAPGTCGTRKVYPNVLHPSLLMVLLFICHYQFW